MHTIFRSTDFLDSYKYNMDSLKRDNTLAAEYERKKVVSIPPFGNPVDAGHPLAVIFL